MNNRGIVLLLTAILVIGAAPLPSLALPGDEDQDYVLDAAEEICAGGDGPLIGGVDQAGSCSDGQYDPSTELADVLAALCQPGSPFESRCDGDYYGGPTSATDVDPLWDDLQHYVIDFAFETLGTTLGNAGLNFEPATDADGAVIDADDDGSPDAWNITNPAGDGYVWVPSDFIYGPLSDGNPLFPESIGSLPVPGVPGLPGGGGEEETTEVGPVSITRGGEEVRIAINDDEEALEPLVTVIVNLTELDKVSSDPVKLATTNKAVVIDFRDGRIPPVNVPGFALYYAPLDFNYLVVSAPNDIDGDGYVTGAEHFTGPENGWLFSNPVNRKSFPGDADADDCPFDHPGEDDTTRTVDPCFILPYTLDFIDVGSELGDPLGRVWETISVDFAIHYNEETSFTSEEAEIGNWRIWWNYQNNSVQPAQGVVCNQDDFELEVIGDKLETACTWDTADPDDGPPDTTDFLLGTSTTTDRYYAFLEVCLADQSIAVDDDHCFGPTDPIEFIVENLPKVDYKDTFDAVEDDEDDREGRFSDDVILQINASHAFYDIESFEINVCGAEVSRTAGQNAAGLGSNACTAPGPGGVSLGTFFVGDSNVKLHDSDPWGNLTWNITLDSETFPQASAPNPARPPRSGMEAVGETRGLMQTWDVGGARFHVTTTHEGGKSRLQENVNDDTRFDAAEVFNNRPPELSDFNIDVTDTETPILELGFHYYDPDGTATSGVAVQVIDPDTTRVIATVDCEQLPSNDIDGLLDDQTPLVWIDNPADFVCEWNANGFDRKAYNWKALVPDADGSETVPVEFLSTVQINLLNQPPALSGATVEPANLADPFAVGQPYTIRVHYSDATDAPGEVTVTLVNPAGDHEPKTASMARCTLQDDLVQSLPFVSDPTEVDFCVDVTLPGDSIWTYSFHATDSEDASTTYTPDPNEIDVSEVVCDHCRNDGEAAEAGKAEFDSLVNDLNEAGIQLPISGHDMNQIFGFDYDDSDGDMVPGPIEVMLLNFDVFTVDAEDRTVTFEDEWVIQVLRPAGSGQSDYPILTITISREEGAPFYTLDACSSGTECLVEDQDLAYIDLETTPLGLSIVAYEPDGTVALRFVLDVLNLGSAENEFVNITIGDTYLDIMTNPLDVREGGAGLHPGGDGVPTAGFKRTDNGLVAYVDPDGSGPGQPTETGGLNPGDAGGLTDGDGDGMPDAAEIVHCYTIHSISPDTFGGACYDRDGDGLFEEWEP